MSTPKKHIQHKIDPSTNLGWFLGQSWAHLAHFEQKSTEKQAKKNISTVFLVPLSLVRFKVCAPPYSRVSWLYRNPCKIVSFMCLQ